MRIQIALLLVSLAGVNAALANESAARKSLEDLARKAASSDSGESAHAVTALRSEGPAGVEAFLNVHAEALERERLVNSHPPFRESSKLSAVLDALCQQHDCYSSRLYWYTDFEEARRAARATGKPILSLRLLGRLDEDMSCANSRFFRIALYANSEVSRYLRENFVLHWKSERPVPKVTIDFGDGRKLERTVTGNSIHYVLDQEGRPIDALPGLYCPQAFLQELKNARQVASDIASASTQAERQARLQRYHQERLSELERRWAWQTVTMSILPARTVPARGNSGAGPSAVVAGRATVAKSAVEKPLLRGLLPGAGQPDSASEDDAWSRIAQSRLSDARMDQSSRALMRTKNPAFNGSSSSAIEAFERAVAKLERLMAEDTTRNEYVLHAQLHRWFVEGRIADDIERLNERVYTDLFLTPRSDPWLGLLSLESYSGLDNEGIR